MHGTTRPVTVFGEELRTLVRDMFATMRASGEVGLAATRVGVDLAVFTCNCPDANEDLRSGAVFNPAVALAAGLGVTATIWRYRTTTSWSAVSEIRYLCYPCRAGSGASSISDHLNRRIAR